MSDNNSFPSMRTDSQFDITYSLYDVLEVRPPCKDEDITKAYRRLALRYHPDKRTRGPTTEDPEMFQKLKAAHEILKDPVKREYYDRFGDQGLEYLMKGSGVSGKVKGLERFVLRVMTRPRRIIPLLILFGCLGILFILFLNLMDRKLHSHGLNTVSWHLIWTPLWILEVIFGLAFFVVFIVFSVNFSVFVRDTEETKLSNLPSSLRKWTARLGTLASGFGIILSSVLFGALIFSQVLAAKCLDHDGSLRKGYSWSEIFEPLVGYFLVSVIVKVLFSILTLHQYRNPKRKLTERTSRFINDIFNSAIAYGFLLSLTLWLDASERSWKVLLLVFSIAYLSILASLVLRSIHIDWDIEDSLSLALATLPLSQHESARKSLESSRFWRRFGSNCLFIGQLWIIASWHSHLLGCWPYTWTMAFLPLVLLAGVFTFTFCFCCPCIIACMDLALPANSFQKYEGFKNSKSAGATSSPAVIIEIPSVYLFGFGLAPIQPRIVYTKSK